MSQSIRSIFLLCSIAALNGLTALSAQAQFLSDPPPSFAETATEFILHKELNGLGSYGQFDHAADILYTGNTGTWHFTIPDTVNLSDIQAPFFRASLVSDDHGSGISNYTYSVATNGTTVAAGETGLPYGSPGGSTFNNWVQRDYSLTITGTANNITLTNTSAAGGGDWIAVDWIELHLPKSAVVPAPSALLTALMGAVPGATLLLRRRRK